MAYYTEDNPHVFQNFSLKIFGYNFFSIIFVGHIPLMGQII